jgi:hypothetical protein
MKRYSFIIAMLAMSIAAEAQRTEVISQSGNSITVRRTYTAVETYKKVSSSETKTGRIGLAIHSNYGFDQSLEFGGSLFYLFGGRANSNFGINAGYDHGLNCWWRYGDSKPVQKYWNVRAGIVIYKYIGLGATYGQFDKMNDWGAYANINLPITKYFGLFVDGKWTQYQHWTVGGGIMFMIPTKY